MSFGLEIEVHAKALVFSIDSIEFGAHLAKVQIAEIIGPTRQQEEEALERIAHKILEIIGVTNAADREKRIRAWYQSSDDKFSLYGISIAISPLPDLPQGHEGKLPFYFSVDHGGGNVLLVPELISRPVGHYPDQALALDAVEHIKHLFIYARYFSLDICPSTPTPCSFIHPQLSKIAGQVIKLTGQYRMIHRPAEGTQGIEPELSPSLYIQITTTIDLSHFSTHGGRSPYLYDFFDLDHSDMSYFEMCTIVTVRSILQHVKNSYKFEVNPWIEGAIGLAISQVFILFAGLLEPGKSVNKNLWVLFPKTSIQEILQEAFRADILHYTVLVDFIGTIFATPDYLGGFFRHMDGSPLLPESQKAMCKLLYQRARDHDVITRRLKYLIKDFTMNPSFIIERAIHALLMSVVFDRVQLTKRNHLWAHVDQKELEEYFALTLECFGSHRRRIAAYAQPGTGRPKFELRLCTRPAMKRPPYLFDMHDDIDSAWADIPKLVEIINGVGKHCVQPPAGSNRRAGSTIDTMSALSSLPVGASDRIWFPGLREQWWDKRKKKNAAGKWRNYCAVQ